ncbi:leucyl/phenylalanyl-tRNA--protein transferase [Rhodoferax sp. GW822-FHT02A01]|uniref:leucyl/phenylalanyl-tRNA--protein transferase n=1 Tax=Rhodoferax sp. GW822-FHT02A01 TaxID=3141537 RepID=UPI00315DC119
MPLHPRLPWLEESDAFPVVERAWSANTEAPGLLAAGGQLSVPNLLAAYSNGIFPWYSEGQPTLWWSPDPRMVLQTGQFRLHRSLKRTIKKFQASTGCEIRFDSAFNQVISNCALASRRGQNGTWILPEMVDAYQTLHMHGYAHSVETWIEGQLAGGLYCVAIGQAVFGESMFAHRNDASKMALAALVGFCLQNGVESIDCQQNTGHLASLGAAEIPRSQFVAKVQEATRHPALEWKFDALYWQHILDT